MDNIPAEWSKMHHAYILSGISSEELWCFLEDRLFFKKRGNPDALDLSFETFGIDESRNLQSWSINKPFLGERKVAIILSDLFTFEAQNALLKLFEEPPPGTYFFILARDPKIFLPTFISRTHVVVCGKKNKEEIGVKKFMENTPGNRLQIISSIIKNKDKKRAKDFVFSILTQVRDADIEQKKKTLPLLLNSFKFLSGRSPSVKMILEHLAFML